MKSYFLFLYRRLGLLEYIVIESENGSNPDALVDELMDAVDGNPDNTWIIYGFETKIPPERLPV